MKSWLERFIQDGGMQILAKELGSLHKKKDRYEQFNILINNNSNNAFLRVQNDYKIEFEILKCLHTLMNKKVNTAGKPTCT